MTFKLVSLNLAGYWQWSRRQAKIISFLNEMQPDVLLLQEAKFDPAETAFSQPSLLNAHLENTFPYVQTSISRYHKSDGDDAYREGLAVLSRYPIQNSETLVLIKNDADEHTRIVQNVDLTIKEQLVKLSNVHFSNNRFSDDQFSELIEILSSRHESRIICGDFNIFDIKRLEAVYKKSYTASTDYKTYISFPEESLTLDYALLPRSYEFRLLETVEGLSDHAALVLTISSKQQ